jgi:exopolysaccharide biosynthesis WecB/TagA/CpsF family protein
VLGRARINRPVISCSDNNQGHWPSLLATSREETDMSFSDSHDTVLEHPSQVTDARTRNVACPSIPPNTVAAAGSPTARKRVSQPRRSSAPSPPAVGLLGLDFADLDADRAAAWLAERPAQAPFGYVVTPNADHLVRLAGRPDLAPIYRAALLRLLDSRVVAAAALALRLPVPRVAPGSDVTEQLLTRYLRPDEPVTIIGLRAQWLPALVARYGLSRPAHYDPPMGFAADPAALAATVAFVLAHPARFVFLAVGSPQQEVLAAAIAATGRATGTGLCIGASLEFLAGAARRAPRWMQRAGLEWLYRLQPAAAGAPLSAGQPRRGRDAAAGEAWID